MGNFALIHVFAGIVRKYAFGRSITDHRTEGGSVMVGRNVFRTAAFVMLLGLLPGIVFGVSAVSASVVQPEAEKEAIESATATPTAAVEATTSLAEVLLAAHPGTVTATGRLRTRDVRIASPASP